MSKTISKLFIALCTIAMPCALLSNAFADEINKGCPIDSKMKKTECICDVASHHNGLTPEENTKDIIDLLNKVVKPEIKKCFNGVAKSKHKSAGQIKQCNYRIDLSIGLSGSIQFSRVFGCAIDEELADLNNEATQCVANLVKEMEFCPGIERKQPVADDKEGPAKPVESSNDKPLVMKVTYQFKKNAFSEYKEDADAGNAAPVKKKVSL